MAENSVVFDLSQISLPAGSPIITATALAEGIAESERSNAIEYSKEYLKYDLYGTGAWKITGINDQYKGISTVIIPSEINGLPVKKIDTNAFAGDTSIQRVNIPATIEIIGTSAFEGCSNLTEVHFVADSYYTIYFRNYNHWTNVCCSEKRNYTFPYGEVGREMTYVENDGKYDVYSIRVLKTASGTSILNSIKFSGLNNTGEREYTPEIQAENIDDCVCWYMPYGNVSRHNAYVPMALQSGSYAFANTAIQSIVLPNKMGVIAPQMFYDCKSLESVTLPSTARIISDETFYGCSALTSITIPEYVTTIGSGAFSASGLTNLIIPWTVNVIGQSVCRNCESLTSVTINSGGTIPDYAFAGCSKLQEVIYGIQANITSIGTQAFYDTKLSRVTIPKSVIWIGVKAFHLAEVFHAVFEHPKGWHYTETGEPSGGTLWNPQNIIENNSIIESESVALAAALRGDLKNQIGEDVCWYRLVQMPAPTISIAEGAMLTITDYSGLAEFFKIYINDEDECRATINTEGQIV